MLYCVSVVKPNVSQLREYISLLKEELAMPKLSGTPVIELFAVVSKNLDTTCYRGSAPLAHLALISQGDVFDQEENPEGIQRGLLPKHASDAYEYVHSRSDSNHPRAYPEVVLNIRDKKVVQVEPISESLDHDSHDGTQIVHMKFDLNAMRSGKVSVSRVDGNHRLFYADGDERRDPLMASAPFQIHYGLTKEQERSLFFDINSNQKGLNTSHLAIMQHRLTPEQEEIKDHLDRWIANKLTEDPLSPWHGMVHKGGSKQGARLQGLVRPVNFVALQTGVDKLLKKSQYIRDFTDANAQYVIVRNYWKAVKTVFATEWGSPKEYLLLRNLGVVSFSILGGTIIDRCIPRGKANIEDMAFYLRQVRSVFDWRVDAIGDRAVRGMTGGQASMIVAASMAQELNDGTGDVAVRNLQEMLINQTESI